MTDWRQQGHAQRRRMGAPANTLVAARPNAEAPSFESGISDGMSAQSAALGMAVGMGHRLGSWSPYGANSMKAKCIACGAEARVPFSVNRGTYQRPEGQAVNPTAGSCSLQARRHPRRKRGSY